MYDILVFVNFLSIKSCEYIVLPNNPRLVFANVLYESLNENEYGFVIGDSVSVSGVPKLGLNADSKSIKATNGRLRVLSPLSLYKLSSVLK